MTVASALEGVGCSDDSDSSTAQATGGAGGTAGMDGGATSTGSGGAGPEEAGAGGATPDAGVGARLKAKADGWAAFRENGDTKVTQGGNDADAAHTYTVTNRKELIVALYPDAVIAPNGTFTSAKGADATPKIIYVKGTISLNTNAAGIEQTEADYACAGYSWPAYIAAYDPKVWNKQALVNGRPPALPMCATSLENLRSCSAEKQRNVVRIEVGSNTSILGLGADAKIVHGSLVVGRFPKPTAVSTTPCEGVDAGTGDAGAKSDTAPADAGAKSEAGIASDAGSASDAGAKSEAGIASDAGSAGEAGPKGDAGTASEAGSQGDAGTVSDAGTATPLPAFPPAISDNVIIRNIKFEDAFDLFPAWSPTDSYTAPPLAADPTSLYPKCQATLDAATDNGPHQCPGGRWNSDYDNVSVYQATHVFIDHCDGSDGDRQDDTFPSVWAAPYVGHDYAVQHHDGVFDVTGPSNYVTISYNHIFNHDKTLLLGSTDTATVENGFGQLSVTVHHNFFENAGQRLPRVRFGKVHAYDNYYAGEILPIVKTAADLAKVPAKNPVTYGLGIGYLARLYSENNVFDLAPFAGDPAPTESAMYFLWHKASPTSGTGYDVGDRTYFFDSGSTLNGAAKDLLAHAQLAASAAKKPALSATDGVWKPSSSYAYSLTPAAEVKALVKAQAGAGKL